MKKTLFALLLVLSVAAFVEVRAQQSSASDFEQANAAYAAGNYTDAAVAYERIIEQGGSNWELYYNLGSAYFKNNEIGRAVLNFERAARLAPSSEDVAHNLAVAKAKTVDKIDSVPQFFVVEWAGVVGGWMSSDGWAMTAIALFACALGFALLWRLRLLRSGAIGGMVVMAVLSLTAFLYANSTYNDSSDSDRAVIVNTASVVRSSPDSAGKELFVLHEGTVVDVIDNIGSWNEIRIASGNKGWVNVVDIEQI